MASKKYGYGSPPFLLLLGISALLLSSCAAPQGGVGSGATSVAVYRINVMRFTSPVEVVYWPFDMSNSAHSEGAALNIVTAMQRGDVDGWLNCWAPDERPHPDAAERQKLLEKWAALKDGHINVLGRVVAGVDLIEEISVQEPSQRELLQFPLKNEGGKWWLINMDPDSEYMRWESSPSKLVERVDSMAFRHYLKDVNAKVN
ncbi:MAG TPA: hypothetical protein VG754_10440 [Verrucomicrobiae bacterium]|nr:hypothetical protein [Verrucomicrobiae bacterium]